MKEGFEHRPHRDTLSIVARLSLAGILVAAWLSAAGGSSQPETPFQQLGPASTATAPDKGPHPIFEAKPAPLLPTAPSPRNK